MSVAVEDTILGIPAIDVHVFASYGVTCLSEKDADVSGDYSFIAGRAVVVQKVEGEYVAQDVAEGNISQLYITD